MIKRYRNPYFWIGLVSVMIAASGVDFEALTSWKLLADGLVSIVVNPVTLVTTALAGLAVFINPTTKGFKD